LIELLLIAVTASVVGLIGPLGLGWVWDAILTREGDSRLSGGMIYWLGLKSLGALILLGYGLAFSRTLVVSLVASACASGWIWTLLRGRRVLGGGLKLALPLFPLALVGIAYCVLDPVRLWDSYLIWLARVRLLEQWMPLSEFRDLRIVYPEYPFLGAAAWWWTEWSARVPVEGGRVIFLFAYLAFFLAVLTRQEGIGGIRFRLLWLFLAYACFSLEIINGYQDGFLMVSAGMVALAFLEFGDRGLAWIPPLAGGLALIKAEGAVLASMLVFSWFVSQPSRILTQRWTRPERRGLLVGLLGFAVILGLWPWLLSRNGLDPANVQGGAFRIRSLEVLVGQADRIPRILWEITHHYAQRPWITIPFATAVASLLVQRQIPDQRRRFLLGFVTLHLLFVTAVFWVTQAPFEWHLGAAMHRLLMQGELIMLLYVFETATLHWAPVPETSNLDQRVSSRQNITGVQQIRRPPPNTIWSVFIVWRRHSHAAAPRNAHRTV
jgi:hypothetical protein